MFSRVIFTEGGRFREKFPVEFPVVREFFPCSRRIVDSTTASRRGAGLRATGHARKTRIRLATAGNRGERLPGSFAETSTVGLERLFRSIALVADSQGCADRGLRRSDRTSPPTFTV